MGIRHFAALCRTLSFAVVTIAITTSASYAAFDFGKPQAAAIPSVTYKEGAHKDSPFKGNPAPQNDTAPLVLSNDKDTMNADEKEAPAFEVYQERYVPDTVKKKYGLSDDWYGNKPQPLVPDTMAAPQIKPQSAAKADDSAIVPMPLFARIPKEMLRELKQVPTTAPTDVNSASTASIEPAAGNADTVFIQGQPRNYTQSWRARKGENFRDVLRRWSERENTELMWASPDNPTLEKDFSYFGKYQDAVARLMSSKAGNALHSQYRSEGLAPTMMTPASTVTTSNAATPEPQQTAPMPLLEEPANRTGNEAVQQQSMAQPYVPEPQKRVSETRWLGLTGAPMSEVLKVWSEDAGVNFVWQAERDYAMRSSVSKVGTFEEAVYAALSQYDDAPVRPVGEMYRDAASGQTYLVVRDDAGR